ncbi:glutaminase, partial [Teladorsagia circumcincta]
CLEIRDGTVASYIPQLARQSPELWGVSVCTVDGQRISFGDSKKHFCVQSVSKAFNYAIAASDLGNEPIMSIPMWDRNQADDSSTKFALTLKVITQYRKIAGGEYIGFNNATFLSERATADRNYALSYYMKEKKCFPPEVRLYMQGVDLSTSDYDRRTPLHVAASEGDLNMVKFLVNVAKVDVDARD